MFDPSFVILSDFLSAGLLPFALPAVHPTLPVAITCRDKEKAELWTVHSGLRKVWTEAES